ncbi:hypothetical protein [Streptomyces aureoversilis]|uniref:Uncharacterized protein n=1 Tax=Streptomyces aureoversilis TaxID=67277 RepID=A0ABW0A5F8_9ACTN
MPPDAEVGEVVDQLRRALHTIECRELGPEASTQRFGQFADLGGDRRVIFLDPDGLLARHPEHGELHALLGAVQRRGPAVDVTLAATRG